MELVYLWVEEYKNIKNQGFNFSPRFTCKYENGELTITENKHHSIFPDNINVTAIVGKNGSGKSTILEIIKLLLINEHHRGFIVWKSDKTFYYQSTMAEIKSIHKIIKKEKANLTFFTHSSDVFNTLLWMNQKNKLYDCDNPMIFGNLTVQNPNNLRMTHISLNIPIYYAYSQNFVLYYFLKKVKKNKIFNPTHYKFMQADTYFVRKLNDILSYHLDESGKLLEKIKQEMKSYVQKIIYNPKNIKIINRLYVFLENLKSNNDIEKANGLYQYIKEFKIPSSEEMENLIFKSYGENFSSTLNSLDKLDITNVKILENDKDLLLKIMQNELSKNIFTDVYHIILYEPTETDLYKTYDDLSTGEKDSLLLIALIYKSFEKKQKQDSIILLDEIETFYHPNWAKNFFNILFEEIKNEKIHLIMTSHSPFLLSDLPKENAIFLENGKQVYPHIETFGANIHTLLSHGFFMKDGLMGEFAKSKINEVIDYLNGKDSPIGNDDEAQRYIHIIGEPIVKRQLQRMLDSKKLGKMKEIDALKSQIESLKNRLDILVNKS